MAPPAALSERWLSAQDLLGPSTLVHDIDVPEAILHPGVAPAADGRSGRVRLRPLTIAALTAISRAARDDASLVPLLMIKESLAEPALGIDAVRRLNVGLVGYLVGRINEISGLTADGEALEEAASSPTGRTHLLLARHFGWTPQQVAELTPGQVAVYLAGVARLVELEERG
jgi:hypothetical protein